MIFSIVRVRGADDIISTRTLFQEYVDGLAVNLTFQGIENEFADLPGAYAPPRGELFLAKGNQGEALGSVGLRPLQQRVGASELKRLYVRETGRGMGIGRALASAALNAAAEIGYEEVVLDSLPSMNAAIAIYRSLGFEPIQPYSNKALPGTLFFGKRIVRPSVNRR